MNPYWRLVDSGSDRLLLYDGKEMRDDCESCPTQPEHASKSWRCGDLIVDAKHSYQYDILWTWMSDCLVHERLIPAIEDAGFGGYMTKPVVVRFPKGVVSHAYRELVVLGWGGVADPASGIRVIKECPTCLHRNYSHLEHPEKLVNWEQWDGSDFFMVWPMPKSIFITDRVARFLKKAKVKSYGLRAPAELVTPQILRFNATGFTPGRLWDYMPSERAEKLEARSGLDVRTEGM